MRKFKDYIRINGDSSHVHNIHLPAWKIIEKYKDDPSIFITFTKIPKVGINPNSGFDTPFGIYCYPLKETFEKYDVEELKNFSKYPFPQNHNKVYVGIIKLKTFENFMDNFPVTFSEKRLDAAVKYIKNMYDTDKDFANKFLNKEGDRTSFEEFLEYVYKEAKTFKSFGDWPSVKFWNLTRNVGIILADTGYRKYGGLENSKSAIKWNTLLRALGYTGFSDYGYGLIHSNEPTQAVHLSIKNIEIVDIIPNDNTIELPPDEYNTTSLQDKLFHPAENETIDKEQHEFVEKYPDECQYFLDHGMKFHSFKGEENLILSPTDITIKNTKLLYNISNLFKFRFCTIVNTEIDLSYYAILNSNVYESAIIKPKISKSNKYFDTVCVDMEHSFQDSFTACTVKNSNLMSAVLDGSNTIQLSTLKDCIKAEAYRFRKCTLTNSTIKKLAKASDTTFNRCKNDDSSTVFTNCTLNGITLINYFKCKEWIDSKIIMHNEHATRYIKDVSGDVIIENIKPIILADFLETRMTNFVINKKSETEEDFLSELQEFAK